MKKLYKRTALIYLMLCSAFEIIKRIFENNYKIRCIVMMLFIVWVVCIFISASILGGVNKAGTGFLLGLFFGPLGVIFSFFIAMSERKEIEKADNDKKHKEQLAAIGKAGSGQDSERAKREYECPHCAELILKKAKVCKHCGCSVEPPKVADTIKLDRSGVS